jgi:hypothetical protein
LLLVCAAARDTGVVVSLTLPGSAGLRQYDFFDVSQQNSLLYGMPSAISNSCIAAEQKRASVVAD